ncbi:MAG: phenylalanine--tRNA ligase subunit alpha [Dehalococcoidia bacterium]|nr:phenylalanine--tRNA ligase subunit alpha [Dehalococcoidia bacterium]
MNSNRNSSDTLDSLQREALDLLGQASNTEALEAWRVRFLGRSGAVTSVLRGLKDLPPAERPAVGARANQVKITLEEALKTTQDGLRQAELARSSRASLDVTMPGRPFPVGRLHPINKIIREICRVFTAMGFQVVEGPEVEWDYYNFEALNIPKDHPARDMFDTLWVTPEGSEGLKPMLLRTHTSPMQIRVMEQTQPPVRVVVPGRVYRYEATDATHESMFHQVEGLAVDEDITMADLKGALYTFARAIFGQERQVRFRCDYFPFVEPGVEVAVDCFVCDGRGALPDGQVCRLCKGSGWLEVFGAGMVHPQVLRNVGYDPRRYRGFAFGGGLERIAMLRYGIDNIRLFFSNDLRFLRQF